MRTFTMVLEEWLEHRQQEPQDRELGHTDKVFWNERRALEAELNAFFQQSGDAV